MFISIAGYLVVMDESKFCSKCGKTLEPGMQFCPQCGEIVSGSATEEEMKEKQKEFYGIMLYARRNWLIFLLAIYAIPVIVFALIALLDASSTASAIWSSTEFQEWIRSHGFNYSQQDIQNYITYASGLALASGICAAISLACVYMRKKWIIAVAACLAASILCFWSIFGIIIGFLVTWMIVGSKDIFEENPEPIE